MCKECLKMGFYDRYLPKPWEYRMLDTTDEKWAHDMTFHQQMSFVYDEKGFKKELNNYFIKDLRIIILDYITFNGRWGDEDYIDQSMRSNRRIDKRNVKEMIRRLRHKNESQEMIPNN